MLLGVVVDTVRSQRNASPERIPLVVDQGNGALLNRRGTVTKNVESATAAGTSTSNSATRPAGTAGGAGVAPGVPATTVMTAAGLVVLKTFCAVMVRATGSIRMFRLVRSASALAGAAQTRSILGFAPSGVVKVSGARDRQRRTSNGLSSAVRLGSVESSEERVRVGQVAS